MSCSKPPCRDSSHPLETSRVAVYVRITLNSTPVDMGPVVAIECVAAMRIWTADTTVSSVYIIPQKSWEAIALCRLHANLSSNAVVCGGLSAQYPPWGRHRATRRGRKLLDAATSCALHVANTDSPSFVRPCHLSAVQPPRIGVTLVTQRCAYSWETVAAHGGLSTTPSWSTAATTAIEPTPAGSTSARK